MLFIIVAFIAITLIVLSAEYYFPPYPNAFSAINSNMDEGKARKLLTDDGFKKGKDQYFAEHWERKSAFGSWYITCTFKDGEIDSIYACCQRGGKTVRARSRDQLAR
jgi:hypothetical protein